MEPICFKILEAWAEYIGYNKDQTQFNMSTWDLTYHRSTENLSHIINDYDESGLIAVSTVKQLFYQTAKQSTVKIYDLLTIPEGMNKHIAMHNTFQSKELIEAEDRYINTLEKLIQQIIKKKLIGENNKETFKEKVFGYTEAVINALDKCHTEFYKKSDKNIGEITHFTTQICVFPSLAECLLTLDHAPEGMYLCYIDANGSADGYFGFFINSNGNLFSFNERIGEKFRGQHANGRNARWTEGKADGLFPYDFIFKFDKFDYLGYSTEYEIQDDKLSFFELEEDAYLPLLIGMIFIAKKFAGKPTTEFPTFYTDSLLEVNIPRLTSNKNELMVLSQNAIVASTNKLDLNIDYNRLMNGEIFDDFPNREIISNNNGQLFVDLYGKGFQMHAPMDNQYYLAKTQSNSIIEFVATEQKLKAAAVYDVRDQLSTYIKDQMLEEYNNFGGIKAVDKWYEEALRSKLDKIKKLAVQSYVEIKTGKRRGDCKSNVVLNRGTYGVNFMEKPRISCYASDYSVHYIMNRRDSEYSEIMYDLDTNAVCSMLFTFFFADYIAMEEFLETEVPKIMKGWQQHRHGYSCNPLLDMSDRVEGIGTPFEYYPSRNHRYDNYRESSYRTFAFAIGFSKRGFAALAKGLNIQINNLDTTDTAEKPPVEIEIQ